jgi:sulfite reductase (ferredoxin)
MEQKVIHPMSPFPLSSEVLQEIEVFEEEVARLKNGEIKDEHFKPFRLHHGVYGQRQAGFQMFRVKIPQGSLYPAQLRRLADIAETHASGVCHLSTRQNIQMHFAKLEETPAMMRLIAEVGLTTREACSDTVRNVTACHKAGVCPNEVLDVTPYGLAITHHFLRNPVCQKLPRKFKIALEGCSDRHDAVPLIHDIGITAVRREENGQTKVGFRIAVGGGLGSAPRIAHILAECAPPEDLIAICEGIVRVFDRHGQRKNRHKARLKFLIEKIGFGKFTKLWKTEFDALKATNGHYALPAVEEHPRREPAQARDWRMEELPQSFASWFRYNVTPQKQPGYDMVMVKIPLGDIKSDQLRSLADVCERFTDGTVRITIQQNFLMRWVHHSDLPAVHEALAAIGLAEAGAERIEDIVACPGSDSCGLSLTSSRGLARTLAELFPSGDPANDDLSGMSLKISGCQNSCAQHHLASIGFHGIGKKVAGHTSPYYEIYLGGSNSKVAEQIVKIPAKRAPEAVQHLVGLYRSERKTGESFEAFSDRLGRSELKKSLMPYTFLPSYGEDRNYYVDWGDTEDFSTNDLGPGECAGGAYELMEGFLFEADQEIYLAGVMAHKGLTGHAVNNAYRAIIAGTKALLVTQGIESSIDAETLSFAETKLIQKGFLPERYAALSKKVADLGPKDPSPAFAQESIEFARGYVEACRVTFERIDKDLKIKQQPEVTVTPESEQTAKRAVSAHLDLKGVACPYNFVRTKLQLEEMDSGQLLEIVIDDGEPYKNVPRSVKAEGHQIIEEEKIDDQHYRILIEKS